MFRAIKALISGLTGEFDDRERQIRYSWETECPDYVEPEEFVDYMAFGYMKVFTPVNVNEREKIANWLAEDGCAIVDLKLMDDDIYLIGLIAVDEDLETLERCWKAV